MIPMHQDKAKFVDEWALVVLLVLVTLGLLWILLPFYGAIMWGIVIALIFTPLHRRLRRELGGQGTWAALLTMLVVVIIVILPMTLITAKLASDAAQFYQRLQSGELDVTRYFLGAFNALPAWVTTVLDRFGLTDFYRVQSRFIELMTQASKFIATRALGIGMDTFDIVVGLFITLYLAFFMLRDGEALARAMRHATPLAASHKKELVQRFATIIRATVKGNLMIAAIQGTLGGLAFWFLGITGALFWAVLMAFLSLLPAVGAGLVWLPVALFFLSTGAIWQGVALGAFGVLVIGLIDNLLRPALVGKETGLPDYLVMISTLGGMAVFGINGFVLGPAIAGLFVATWHIYAAPQDDALVDTTIKPAP
jgi:predicted PurR-regulated permease PerM